MKDPGQDERAGAAQVAERASTIVRDHVRSIIEAAQARADAVTSAAESDAGALRAQAHDAASNVLEQMDALESKLGDRMSGLRGEAASVSETQKERS